MAPHIANSDGFTRAVARMYQEYTAWPEWLEPHFKGVSIRNLTHAGVPIRLQESTLHLCKQEINDLAGIKSIGMANDVRDLLLFRNRLSAFPGGLLTHFANLERLALSHNALKEITVAMFAGCTRLTKLFLSNNPIERVEPGAFSQLQLDLLSIEDTMLRADDIEQIKQEVLTKIPYAIVRS
jgi:hypothetical protein